MVKLCGECDHFVGDGRVGGVAVDDLDQAHDRNGVHKMQADDFCGAAGGGGDLHGDAGVLAEDAGGGGVFVELAEDG